MKLPRKIVVTNHYDLWNYLFADLEKKNGIIEAYPFNSYTDSSKYRFLFRFCNNRITKKYMQDIWFSRILKQWGIVDRTDAKNSFSQSIPSSSG